MNCKLQWPLYDCSNISRDVKDAYMRPNRAAKVKILLSEALIHFHMCFSEIRLVNILFFFDSVNLYNLDVFMLFQIEVKRSFTYYKIVL